MDNSNCLIIILSVVIIFGIVMLFRNNCNESYNDTVSIRENNPPHIDPVGCLYHYSWTQPCYKNCQDKHCQNEGDKGFLDCIARECNN